MLCVDEPGLYRLILRSDKPEAEPFMEWVTSEVLPALRKTGSYIAPDKLHALEELASTQKQLIAVQASQIEYTRQQAETDIKQSQEQILRLQRQNEALANMMDESKATMQRAIRAQRPIGEKEKAEILTDYDNGLTIKVLQHRYYRSSSIIRRTLREAGVEL